MKKVFLLMLVAGAFMSSCKKEETLTTTVDQNALKAVMTMKNADQIRTGYGVLQPAEKLELWKRHVAFFIQDRTLSTEQREFVANFEKQLVEGVFIENSTSFKAFTAALPELKYRAQLILGVPDAFALLIDLAADKSYYQDVKKSDVRLDNEPGGGGDDEGDDGLQPRCSCSQTDPYCSAGRCASTDCRTKSAGCGTLWLFECNGKCSLL
jgi:hypothetical protein